MGQYASNADVAGLVQLQGGYTTTSQPTASQVDQWILQIEAEIDTHLNDCGYAVPVVPNLTAGLPATKALMILRTITVYGAASLALQPYDEGQEAGGPKSVSRSAEYRDQFESMLNDIISGAMKLFDAATTSLVADFPKDLARSGNLEPPPTWTGGAPDDGTTRQPIFTTRQVF